MSPRRTLSLLPPAARVVPLVAAVPAAVLGGAWLLLIRADAPLHQVVSVVRGATLMVSAAGASVFDDPATSITQATPAPVRVRAGTRIMVQLGVVVAAWSGVVALASWRSAEPLPVALLFVELATLVTVGWAVAAWWRRGSGDLRAGHVAAPALLVFFLAARELPQRLSLFTWDPADGTWGASQTRWVALGAVAVAAVITALREPLSRQRSRQQEDP